MQMTTTVEQLLARLGSGIESTPGVCGGDQRIAGTRIPVWTLEHYRRLGLTEAQILGAFPALRATDLVNAWSYYPGNKEGHIPTRSASEGPMKSSESRRGSPLDD
jgi:uncharacterized protein (DUF433 family)